MARGLLIHDITEARSVSGNTIQVTKRLLEEARGNGERVLHNKYVANFNAIDLHDRLWYSLQNHHALHTWQSKFTMSLLISGVVNAIVVQKHFEGDTVSRIASKLRLALCQQQEE
jgi:hypothetical protein